MVSPYIRPFIRPFSAEKARTISGFFFQARYECFEEDIELISYIPVTVEAYSTQMHHNALNFLPEEVVVLASSNGLICCRSSNPNFKHMTLIYVCNPLNKDSISLEWPKSSKVCCVALAFDPYLELIDSMTNFSVIAVCRKDSGVEQDSFNFSFQVYSSKSGAWRRSREICECDCDLVKDGVFVKGVVYWLTDRDKILMFDCGNELSWLINVPLPVNQLGESIPATCIGQSHGQLHYVLMCEDGLQLWALVEPFASDWELKDSIDLDTLEKENSELLYQICEKLAYRDTSDKIPLIDLLAFKDGILLMRVLGNMILYHFESKKVKQCCTVSDLGQYAMFSPLVVPYTMSLVPLAPA